MKMNWKVLAIVFIILFIAENLFLGWGYYLIEKDLKLEKECLWDFCGEYPDADYYEDVCVCYDYDHLGELVIVKSEVMN